MIKLRIGTRGSKLALKQTEIIADKLKKAYSDLKIEIVEIKTTGDKLLDISLSKIGGKGLFIKEIEEALLNEDIDIAVHSLKDMPAKVHEKLMIAAYSIREDASDCLISKDNITFDKLPKNAVVGTSSLRRICQLRELRPDFEFKTLRGIILTRIKKLDDGEFDAIVLASAGLIRLGLEDRITQKFDIDTFIPAVCQGILCVEARSEDKNIIEMLKITDDKNSRIAATCERAFLEKLNGNCKIPLGAYCIVDGENISMTAILGNEETGRIAKTAGNGTIDEAEKLGYSLAEVLKDNRNN